ncbi:unnamed protein product [Hymenolepis diminuta]|uniref:Skp1_POZ domain-containing protein n=1 Tax=Hymenolepis diminuta TaxID=6216 RepID=A0A0R3SNV5_HYMDI|nr:unnamed protein product [Hymenolepis diminuta]VUZ43121.1 unnamed protein product [Hymenolepis diminuta]
MFIRIRTNENVILEIAEDIVSLIPLLSDTANGLSQSDGEIEQDEAIDLNKVTSETLQAVIEWCNYHKICTPENDNRMEGPRSTWQLCQWDRAFFLEKRRIYEDIMEAAIILEMDNLSDACSVYNAQLFHDFQDYGESLSFRY